MLNNLFKYSDNIKRLAGGSCLGLWNLEES